MLSGREDEWHDWSLKFGAIAATLSDHKSVDERCTATHYGENVGSTRCGIGADVRATDVYPSHSSV